MSTSEYIQLRDDLLKKLLDTKDLNILEQIKDVFKRNNGEEDFFDELPKEIQNRILKSIEQADNGELIPYEDMMRELR